MPSANQKPWSAARVIDRGPVYVRLCTMIHMRVNVLGPTTQAALSNHHWRKSMRGSLLTCFNNNNIITRFTLQLLFATRSVQGYDVQQVSYFRSDGNLCSADLVVLCGVIHQVLEVHDHAFRLLYDRVRICQALLRFCTTGGFCNLCRENF